MRDTYLILHILAAGTWIGASVSASFLGGTLGGRSAGRFVTFMEGFGDMGKRIFPPAGGLVLITGILLVIDSDFYEFSDAFVGIGIAAVIIGIILGTAVFDPLAKKAVEAGESMDDATHRALRQRFLRFGVLDMAVLAIAVIVMVTKLGV